jgi:hypothetical protein
MKVGSYQFIVTKSRNDLFYRLPRAKTFVASVRPDEAAVQREGDYVQRVHMRHFTDGTVSLERQQDEHGNVVLSVEDALRALQYDNPLRDAVVLVARDGHLALKDGFHRIHEALARGYKGTVHCIVLDMDASDTDDD